ncbi:MAG: DUF2750 domain-containing protein [Planctomycetota bacterium]
MHPKQFESVTALDAPNRYSYFVRKVADFEKVWGLFEDGWALMGDDAGNQILPVWPEREFAEALAQGDWATHTAKAISLKDFVEKWLPGMEKDGKQLAVFPTPSGKGVLVAPPRLLTDLRSEMKQYE